MYYKWLFQLDDSKSLHGKWLFHQTSIYKWLFGVPGSNDDLDCKKKPPSFVTVIKKLTGGDSTGSERSIVQRGGP